MSDALRWYPRRFDDRKVSRNGMLPNSAFMWWAMAAHNHILSYRRKVFFTVGDYDNLPNGTAGTREKFRFRCHTGYGATSLMFRLGLGFDSHATGTDPTVAVDVYDVAAATTESREVHHGFNNGGTNDAPDDIVERIVVIPVTANRTYEVLIKEVDYARVIDCCAFEVAGSVIDTGVDFYVDPDTGGAGYPITDALRERMLGGQSSMWRRNGGHLYTWPGTGGTNPTFTGTTSWKNIYDDSTAAPASTTPGPELGDADWTLEPMCRESDGTDLDCILAVHCSVSGGATGEVRFQNAAGTICSITGMGTAAGWYQQAVKLADVDALLKADVQARVSNAAHILTLNSVCLYTYLA